MKLFFKVKVLDYQGNIAKKRSLALEFFNTDTNIWEKIDVEEAAYNEGNYAFEYEIPSRIYGDQPTLRKVREVLQAGGMPLFRLIDENSEKQVYVLASQGIYEILEENILCDFKMVYFLPEEAIENLDNPKVPFVVIASSTTIMNEHPDIEELEQEIVFLKEQLKNAETTTNSSSNTDELIAQIEALNNIIRSLEDEQNILVEEKENLEQTIVYLTEQNEALQLSVNEGETDNTETENVIETLQSEKQALNEQLQEVIEQKAALEITFNENNSTIESLQSQLEDNNQAIESLNAEKIVLENTIAQEVAIVNNQIAEINTYKNKELQQQNTIETLEGEKETLKNQMDQLSETTIDKEYVPKSVSANKLYTDVIDEIQIAKENTAAAGFKLSNISINLKTVAEQDDQGLRFQVIDINNASSINGAAISDIKIDIAEDITSTTTGDLVVPKLIGLTETAARKYLERFNLRLDPVYQFINTESSSISEGQAFRQSPEPGEVTPPDATITVIFAKNNQHLN